jgi:methylthioxylose transferase
MPTDTHAPVGYPIAWCAMSGEPGQGELAEPWQAAEHPPGGAGSAGAAGIARERRDLVGWLALAAVGLVVTWLAVRAGARLGTASAPFLGSYRLVVSPMSLLAPIVAAVVVGAGWRGWFRRAPWWLVSAGSAAGLFGWAVSLALVDGVDGLTRSLTADSYLGDVTDVGDDPLGYLRDFTGRSDEHTFATRGHPPAPVLLFWAAQRVGIIEHVWLGVAVIAFGALTAPLVLAALRDVSGEAEARSYAPVLMLAPYAVWLAVSMDAVVATIAASMMVAGVRATRTHGWRAAGWALLAGLLLGAAALFSYSVAWLGLSIVFLYFARRRAALNLFSGLGVLAPLLGAAALGFGWTDGLATAYADFAQRIEPHRSAAWWSVISICALLIAVGPPLAASVRKLRNTPSWPFLVGAAAAVVFSIGAGLARGGVEHAWLTYFPWLTIAAAAPERPGGEPVGTPLVLVTVGALTAMVIEAVLATPW